jgi:hypothetical protein
MSTLPGRPSLDQLRRQARELHRAAADGDEDSVRRVRAVSPRPTLSAAQLAIARAPARRQGPADRRERQSGMRPAAPPVRRLVRRAQRPRALTARGLATNAVSYVILGSRGRQSLFPSWP